MRLQAEIEPRRRIALNTVKCNVGRHSECPGVMPISSNADGVCSCACHKQSLFEEASGG